MKISLIKRMSKSDREFYKKEWKIADIEHHDKEIDWSERLFYLKAVENGETVGVLEFTLQVGVVWVKDLIVAHNRRRQGIGRELVLESEKVAKKYKAHKIFLNTGIGWGSEKFYERLGYKKTGTLLNHHYHQDHVIFSKFI